MDRIQQLGKNLSDLRSMINRIQADLDKAVTERVNLETPPAGSQVTKAPEEITVPKGKPGRKANLQDPRLPPPGTRIVRRFHGVNHVIRVEADGFYYMERKWGSLSAIARDITKIRTINGFRFFGLD